MVAVTTTLYEDWQRRHSKLQSGGAPQGRQYIDVQLHVLDFLLQRYENSEVGNQPARFPLNTEMVWNKRALVVHHHLARNQEAGRKKDISKILKRMSGQDAQSNVGTPGGGALLGTLNGGPVRWNELPFASFHIDEVQRVFNRLSESIEINPVLPQDDLRFLRKYIHNGRAVEMLTRCKNLEAADIIASAFRDGYGYAQLHAFLDDPIKRPQAADRFRAELATPDGKLRLRVIEVVGEIGTLDDIGLLMDLLALPIADDEMPGEREALTAAMNEISEAPAA
jgi:hypothetical protein